MKVNNDPYHYAPAIMYDGISVQYGMKLKDDGPGYDNVYFNFTVYENGEVRISGGSNVIIMDAGAYSALSLLWESARDKFKLGGINELQRRQRVSRRNQEPV